MGKVCEMREYSGSLGERFEVSSDIEMFREGCCCESARDVLIYNNVQEVGRLASNQVNPSRWVRRTCWAGLRETCRACVRQIRRTWNVGCLRRSRSL